MTLSEIGGSSYRVVRYPEQTRSVTADNAEKETSPQIRTLHEVCSFLLTLNGTECQSDSSGTYTEHFYSCSNDTTLRETPLPFPYAVPHLAACHCRAHPEVTVRHRAYTARGLTGSEGVREASQQSRQDLSF